MTTEQFLALPSREQDALVAEKVMIEKLDHHWIRKPGDTNRWCDRCGYFPEASDAPACSPKPYSTDIRAAWEVLTSFVGVEKFICTKITQSKKGWKCNIDTGGFTYGATAQSAPLAICLAALKAVGFLED